jgi:predicted SAM-dependent methyltransferase
MRKWIADIPIIGGWARWAGKAFRGWRNTRLIRKALHRSPLPLKIVIGASSLSDPGWIPTEIEALNILCESDWERFFTAGSIDAILAEHVWEHLTPEEALRGAQICFRYLKPGGYLRIAVPDGNFSDPEFIARVQPGGVHDHRALYTYLSARELFERAGFEVHLYEYIDENGCFQFSDWSLENGTIYRSKRFLQTDCGEALEYMSIVLDAVKKLK